MAPEKFKMRRILFVFVFLLVFVPIVYAESNYVLPYPSSMSGSLFYKPRLFLEAVSRYWYFGNFGQFKYNLKQADKYLVESKTLFEYGQYLNASIALKASDEYFEKTLPSLVGARREGKNIEQNRVILSKAAAKHIEVLEKLSKELPDKFEWKPEKAKPTVINIRKGIENSISVRSEYL